MMASSDSPLLLDEILSKQAKNGVQVPLIGYPKDGTIADFEVFTARDLNLLVERAAKHYSTFNIDPVRRPYNIKGCGQ